MIKTGIYGGSFNPIHNGHIALAHQFLTQLGLDEVWFVVSPMNPFKVGEQLLSDATRLSIVRKALATDQRMVACDYEFHLPRPSYMWHTLQAMSRDYPDRELTLLIGGDNWTRFDHWYHADDILNNYRVVVYPRTGDAIDPSALPHGVTLLEAELLDISSTDIRKRIAKGLPIGGMVPPSVTGDILWAYHNLTDEKKITITQ